MQYVEELCILGEAKSGIFNLLVSHVCDTWLLSLVDYTQAAPASRPRHHLVIDDAITPPPSTSKLADPPEGIPGATIEAVVASMKAHTDLLMKAATFGPIHKKNIRLVNMQLLLLWYEIAPQVLKESSFPS